MADQPDATTATNGTPTNGAAKPDARAAFIAAFDSGGEMGKTAPTTEAAKPAVPIKTEKAAPASEPSDDADLSELDDADDFDLDDEPKLDAADAKGMEAVKRYERRARAELDKDRAAFSKERETVQAEAKAQRAELDDLRGKVERGKTDPVALLKLAGWGDDDLDMAGRIIYAHSSAAAADPKNKEHREAAARMARERATGDEMSKLKERLDGYETREKEREQQAAVRTHLDGYFSDATKAAAKVADKLPLLALHMKNAPAGAQNALREIAKRHLDATGELPSTKDLLRAYEKNRRAELVELGVDVPALIGSKGTKVTAKNAEKDDSAKAPKQPDGGDKRTSNARDRRTDFVRRSETGDFD